MKSWTAFDQGMKKYRIGFTTLFIVLLFQTVRLTKTEKSMANMQKWQIGSNHLKTEYNHRTLGSRVMSRFLL